MYCILFFFDRHPTVLKFIQLLEYAILPPHENLYQTKLAHHMIFPQQISYCNQKLINFGTFIREYFWLKPVSALTI